MRIAILLTTFALMTADGTAFAEAPLGKATYERHCQSCHGPDGRGNREKAKALGIDPKLLNLGRPEATGLSREQSRAILLVGKEKMPAYEKRLSPAEVDAVLDYTTDLAKAIRAKM